MNNLKNHEKEKLISGLNEFISRIIEQNEIFAKRFKEYSKDAEIEKLQNEVDNLRRNSICILSKEEKEKADAFAIKHWECCKGNREYKVKGTGIGDVVTVICSKCGAEEDITDFSNW